MRGIPVVLIAGLVACGGGGGTPTFDASLVDGAAIDAAPGAPDAAADASADAAADAAPDAVPPDADPPDANLTPHITSVQVDDGTHEIAQASQRVLVVTGDHLTGVTSAMLGELPCQLLGTPSAGGFSCQVRAGQVGIATAAGPRALTANTAMGNPVSPDMITVTEIYAAPTGDDTTGHGTPAAPYKTLARAAQGVFGETVHLAAGTYVIGSDVSIFQDMKVVGAGRDTTTIQGPGIASVGLFLGSPHAVLTDVTVQGLYVGANASQQATLARARVKACSSTCVYHTVGGIALTDVLVENTSLTAVSLSNAAATRTSATIVGLTISGTSNQALSIAGPIDVSIAGASITGANTGIGVLGAPGLTIRNTTVATGTLRALEIYGDPVLLDLGTAGSSGGNALNGSAMVIEDNRAGRAAPDGVVLQLTGSTLNGQAFATGTSAVGPVVNGSYWNIANANNRLAF